MPTPARHPFSVRDDVVACARVPPQPTTQAPSTIRPQTLVVAGVREKVVEAKDTCLVPGFAPPCAAVPASAAMTPGGGKGGQTRLAAHATCLAPKPTLWRWPYCLPAHRNAALPGGSLLLAVVAQVSFPVGPRIPTRPARERCSTARSLTAVKCRAGGSTALRCRMELPHEHGWLVRRERCGIKKGETQHARIFYTLCSRARACALAHPGTQHTYAPETPRCAVLCLLRHLQLRYGAAGRMPR